MHITAGKFRQRKLSAPQGDWIRPTTTQVRQAVFNICRFELEGARFLDVCAGSGAVGLEALSQGASYAAFIESDSRARRSIEENMGKLQVERQAKVYFGQALKMLERLEKEGALFDIIYIDPPYYTLDLPKALSQVLLEAVDRSALLSQGGLVFVEETSQYTVVEEPLATLQKESSRKLGAARLDLYRRL